jgi:hypothetical protein
MSTNSSSNSETDADELAVYQIRIKGHLGSEWADWFDGLTITLEVNGDTLLTGTVIDQAALYGLLKKVRDLGMPLILVNRVESDIAELPDIKQ